MVQKKIKKYAKTIKKPRKNRKKGKKSQKNRPAFGRPRGGGPRGPGAPGTPGPRCPGDPGPPPRGREKSSGPRPPPRLPSLSRLHLRDETLRTPHQTHGGSRHQRRMRILQAGISRRPPQNPPPEYLLQIEPAINCRESLGGAGSQGGPAPTPVREVSQSVSIQEHFRSPHAAL